MSALMLHASLRHHHPCHTLAPILRSEVQDDLPLRRRVEGLYREMSAIGGIIRPADDALAHACLILLWVEGLPLVSIRKDLELISSGRQQSAAKLARIQTVVVHTQGQRLATRGASQLVAVPLPPNMAAVDRGTHAWGGDDQREASIHHSKLDNNLLPSHPMCKPCFAVADAVRTPERNAAIIRHSMPCWEESKARVAVPCQLE
mmetsp:Transcript_18282/g.42783  ORF Transcript_18282/g.42783 Transcript_18282/m.42783 type:complete len:204 (-) Transcript_18282:1109-1720(-)